MKLFLNFNKTLKILIFIILLIIEQKALGQVNISPGTTVTQDFTIGTSSTAILPTGWKVDKNNSVRSVGSYSAAGTSTENRAGNNMSSSAPNGIYNYAAGYPTSATDRAVGGLSSSSASKSVNVYVQLYNNGAATINNFTISYDVEKYRNGTNSAGFSIQMYYSTDGASWTNAGTDFLTSFSADANNNGFSSAPGATVHINSKTLNVSLNAGSYLYLAWNYSVTSGQTTSNAQALGIDNVSITANSIATPSITVSPNSLSGFSYVYGSGPSAEQSFTCSGENLTDNITLTAPSDYEISLTSGSGFTNSIILNQSGGTVNNTTIYVRLKSGLSVGDYNSENISATSSGATTKNVACSGTVYKPEPTNYPTDFTCGTTTVSSIPLTWTDATGGTVPDGYLIKWSDVSFADISSPTDGSTNNGTNSATVNQGVQSYNVGSLTQNTTYYFKIFPFTNSGSNINYKTDGSVPQTSCNTLDGPCLSENFNSGSLPSGWLANSISFNSNGSCDATNQAVFNAAGDYLISSEIINPQNLTFTYRRSSNSTAWTLNIQVANSQSGPWTTISSVSDATEACKTANIDLSSYSSQTIYIRLYDNRASGNHERYVDDFQIFCGSSCTAPTTQASNISFSNITTTSMEVNFTRGDGDSVIVVARKSSAVNTDPSNGINYNANSNFGSGSQIGTGNYVIYKGIGTSFTVSNLDPSSTYYFAVYEYNAAGPCYLTPALVGNQTTLCGTPTQNATDLVFSSVSSNSITLSWTNGNGSKRIVLAHEDAPINAYPSNNTTYTANTNFGSGSEIGTGNYVIFNGASNSVTVNNLLPGTTYFFKVIEYSCDAGNEKYYINESILEGNKVTLPANVSNLKSTCITNNTLSISWSLPQGNFEGILVTIRQGGTPSNPSCNGADLNNPNTDFTLADVYCGNLTSSKYVYNSTGSSVLISGLTKSQSYTIKVYTYQAGNWSSGTQITKTVALVPVNNAIATPDSSKLKLSWKNPSNCFDEILIVGKQGGSVTSIPSGDGSTYVANSVFGLGTELNAGEYVVYKGTENNTYVNSLTNGLSYCFKIFVRYGTQWSEAVEVCETPADITYLEPTDLAIIAVNTNNSNYPTEEFTIVSFRDIKVGTSIDFTDNGYGRYYPDKWGTTEGTMRLTRIGNGTLPKGTSITVVTTAENGRTNADFDIFVNGVDELALGYWTIEMLNQSNGAGFNLNSQDDIWVMQGGDWQENTTTSSPTYHDDVYTGNVLYGWTATGWPGNDVFGTPAYSLLYPNTDCFTTSLQGITNNSKVRYTGPITPATKLEWIARIGNVSNWTGYSTDALYEAAFPNYRSNGVQWTILSAVPNDGVWTGTRSNDWFDCGNWENLTVPNSTVDVLIGTNATKDILIDKNSTKAQFYNYIAECRNLTINTHNVKLNSNNDTLLVYGDIEINDTLDMTQGGNLKLYGDWTQTDNTLFQSGTGKVILCGNGQQTISANDTLKFNKLNINNTSGSNIKLSTDVIVNDELNQIFGNIDLNGKSLTLKNTYSNTSAAFVGNSASKLNFLNSGSVSNIYFVNDYNLNTLKIDRPTTVNLMTDLNFQNLIINNGKLTLNSNRFYTVSGTLTNSVGSDGLVLHSSALGTASLLLYTPNVQATCERYLSGNIWHYVSSPLSNVQASQLTTTTWGTQNPNFYSYNETVADFWSNDTLYYPTGWTQVGGSSTLQTNIGYIHYSTESNTYNLNGGVLKVDDNSYSLSYTDNGTGNEPTTNLDWDNFEGWNLIGNPYTCAIDWDYVVNQSDTDYVHPVIYYYDGNTANYKYYGTGTIFNQGIAINGGSQYIPANQAFFIKAKTNGNGQTFTIPANSRLHSNQDFYKSAKKQPEYLKLAISQNNFEDEVVLITDKNYKLDIYKKFSFDPSKPQILALNNNKTIHYAALSNDIKPDIYIPLGVYGLIGNNYSIKLKENTTKNLLYYLKDNTNNALYPLFKNKEYIFTNSQKFDTSRFYILFAENHSPFVNLQIEDQFVLVNEQWNFTLPQNLFADKDIYDTLTINAFVDESIQLPEWLIFDGNSFVGTPTNTANYQITLTANDYLGLQASTSFNLFVFCNPTFIPSADNGILIYPNPAQNVLFVKLSNNNQNKTIKILNLEGKTIINEVLKKQNNQLDISKLPAGVYLLNIQDATSNTTTKFIKM